jgi:hypothetical protein
MSFMMVSLIIWATRPELITAQYDRAVAPLQKYLAEKRAAEWQAAKDHAWEEWRKQIRLPNDCSQPTSSLRALECKNALQSYADTFNRDWANKVAGGWRPEGVD